MRDYVGAGRPVAPARDLITRIRLVAKGGAPVAPAPSQPATAHVKAAPATPAPIEPVPVAPAPPPMAAAPVAEPTLTSAALPEPDAEDSAEPAVEAEERAASLAAVAAGPPTRDASADRGEIARVDADLLDNMLNVAGEVSIFRARLEQQVSSIDFNLAELGRVVQRLKDQLRKLEIETEAQILHRHVDQARAATTSTRWSSTVTRRSSSTRARSPRPVSDVASVQSLLATQTREVAEPAVQQGRIVSELQGGLMRTRMVPFQRHVQRLTRIVRQAAAEMGKKAELQVGGAPASSTGRCWSACCRRSSTCCAMPSCTASSCPRTASPPASPRPALIESNAAARGLGGRHHGRRRRRGVNLKAVRDRAVSLGLMTPKQELSDEQALQLILEPGFSTAGKVTQSAGRGVGMDVVATEIKKLGGSLYTET